MTNDDIIKQEIDAILVDIIKAYEASGKKVSGQFEEGLEAVYEPNKGTIKGYVYLAGRKKGKMPPVAALKKWVEEKGISALKKNISSTSLAWAIAKKIAREGTNAENAMRIYEQVITPERIESIIDKVSELNVNRLITEVTAQLQVLQKNV